VRSEKKIGKRFFPQLYCAKNKRKVYNKAMPRVQFSDVTPPERRSIRDVPIPSGGKRKVPIIIKPETPPAPKTEPVSFESRMSELTEKKESGPYEYYYPKNKKESPEYAAVSGGTKKKKWIFGTAAVIVIVVFIVSMMTIFASATIDIVPKSQEIDTNMKIIAASEVATSSVRYEVVKLSKSKTASVAAAGEEAAEVKASGKIVIYNNFSSDPQRLIIRTRFETPEGLIYRIPESVVVPGKTIKDGKEVPGSLETTVFADEAGEKYNIKKTDFTIPGFKNDASRFKSIYARSSTDMIGGFVGKRKTVLPADKAAALQNIDSELQADLKKDLESKIPLELTLLSGSIIYKSAELPQKEGGSSVTLGKEVTAYAVMLNKQDLSEEITKEYISKLPEWDNIKPTINDFSLLNLTGLPNSLETGSKINLQINGKVKVWADIDTNIINQRLLGVPKGEAAKLMNEFGGIYSITAAIRPIWKQSFPDNPSKIYVRVVTAQ
jgi:hypothetical protein